MSKRIIFCCDGTWDSSVNNTNVYKMAQSYSKACVVSKAAVATGK